MSEYLGAAAETAEALRGGWLHTSDLGRLDSGPLGTSLLTVTGRIKHIAKCGGLGVSFEEIERAVLRLAMVREACCVARPHPILGEALSLFVVLGSEPLAACLNDIRDQVRTVVDPRRVGLRILGLDNLPQLRSGKVNRPLLADRALPGRS
jgi:acyl-CoA synthetase (AMP-forming)/AMP-acid ligase II